MLPHSIVFVLNETLIFSHECKLQSLSHKSERLSNLLIATETTGEGNSNFEGYLDLQN